MVGYLQKISSIRYLCNSIVHDTPLLYIKMLNTYNPLKVVEYVTTNIQTHIHTIITFEAFSKHIYYCRRIECLSNHSSLMNCKAIPINNSSFYVCSTKRFK